MCLSKIFITILHYTFIIIFQELYFSDIVILTFLKMSNIMGLNVVRVFVCLFFFFCLQNIPLHDYAHDSTILQCQKVDNIKSGNDYFFILTFLHWIPRGMQYISSILGEGMSATSHSSLVTFSTFSIIVSIYILCHDIKGISFLSFSKKVFSHFGSSYWMPLQSPHRLNGLVKAILTFINTYLQKSFQLVLSTHFQYLSLSLAFVTKHHTFWAQILH